MAGLPAIKPQSEIKIWIKQHYQYSYQKLYVSARSALNQFSNFRLRYLLCIYLFWHFLGDFSAHNFHCQNSENEQIKRYLVDDAIMKDIS